MSTSPVWWILEHAGGAEVVNRSSETGLLALQGPASDGILASLSEGASDSLSRFACSPMTVAGRAALVSRTGYTGAGGFEIYLAAEDTPVVFDQLLEQGRPHGLEPAGLASNTPSNMRRS